MGESASCWHVCISPGVVVPCTPPAMQLGETRTRRLLKPEQYALRHGNKQLRTYAKKLEREGERIGDVIEVLGQVLGNTGLWIHPEDRKKQVCCHAWCRVPEACLLALG
jgi:hypothetical protein